ncbi:MAG: hypothetical protein NDF54_08855 [archaeon GB-1867-035]|nr:hypothetical protein [Candidatus Culexmicrobium profundum]
MDSLEYAMLFTCLIAYLTLTISLISIPGPTFSPTLMLSAINSVAFKPSSTITTRIYIPEGVIIRIHDNTIEFEGHTVNFGVVREYLRFGLIREYYPDKIILNVNLNQLILIGGRIYELKFSCVNVDSIQIDVIRIIGV